MSARSGHACRSTCLSVSAKRSAGAWGFTLIELLCALAIIALLMGILLPSLARMRDSTRKITCASNLKQHGIALTMWTDGPGRGFLPESVSGRFAAGQGGKWVYDLPETLRVHCGDGIPENWDGLGRLYDQEFLDDPAVYYCPSHTGEHPFSRYSESWMNPGALVIYSNYQYRILHPDSPTRQWDLLGPDVTLVADGMRRLADYSHVDGNNMLKRDGSVSWYNDANSEIADFLLMLDGSPTDTAIMLSIWQLLDENGRENANTGSGARDYWGCWGP
ncbi:MAG: type II secretion system protein [Phycisphaerales bacterium]|nr:type II secretion system protein [Phycisphaerales bacterium]